ncbi:Endonuclease YncB, thermonuclease family [Polaromonas sp. OV174]|nr:Endonuclease YncB, thermonuclease family [Polaromonas sp. OV174]
MALFGCTLLLAWGAPAWSAAALPAKWSGVVTQVLDGDTVQVRPSGGGKPVRVRIDGIDAPEICQTGGYLSRDALKRRSLGQRVMVHGRRHDDYGRLLARIVLKGEDQGQWMVAQGLAWSYRYRGHAGPYALQQGRAQAAQRGLFSPTGAAPAIHPRVFRQQHGSCYF